MYLCIIHIIYIYKVYNVLILHYDYYKYLPIPGAQMSVLQIYYIQNNILSFSIIIVLLRSPCHLIYIKYLIPVYCLGTSNASYWVQLLVKALLVKFTIIFDYVSVFVFNFYIKHELVYSSK